MNAERSNQLTRPDCDGEVETTHYSRWADVPENLYFVGDATQKGTPKYAHRLSPREWVPRPEAPVAATVGRARVPLFEMRHLTTPRTAKGWRLKGCRVRDGEEPIGYIGLSRWPMYGEWQVVAADGKPPR